MLGSANMDDQSVWSFLDQLMSTPKGEGQLKNRIFKLQHDKLGKQGTLEYVLGHYLDQYRNSVVQKNKLIKQGFPINLGVTSQRAETALNAYNPYREQHINGLDFLNAYPSSWAHIADLLPQTPHEGEQLHRTWQNRNAPKGSQPPLQLTPPEINPPHLRYGSFRPTDTAQFPTTYNRYQNLDGRGSTGRPETFNVQGTRVEKAFYPADRYDPSSWPIIPEHRYEPFNMAALDKAVKDEEDNLKWSLIPDAYRQVLKGRRNILATKVVKQMMPPEKPEPARLPPAKKQVDFLESATKDLHVTSLDKAALYEAIRNLDEPFHPLLTAGMIHTKFDNPIFNQRVKQQNEAVMKNRMAARKETTPWVSALLYGGDRVTPGRLSSDNEFKHLDPRSWLPGFTNENMGLPSSGSRLNATDKKKLDSLFPLASNLDEDTLKRLGTNKRPNWQRNILGIGGLGAFTTDSLSRQQRQGGRR